MEWKDCFKVQATMVSNEFIDELMAAANGEYLKEYLFLLRHQGSDITVSMIADALNHTEADVNRALAYWRKAGVLLTETEPASPDRRAQPAAAEGRLIRGAETERLTERESGTARMEPERRGCEPAVQPALSVQPVPSGAQPVPSGAQPPAEGENGKAEGKPVKRPVYSPEQVSGLAGDEDFSQLLYIAQKYMNKVFTQRECEVFAYLYDGLSMSAELLEYVVEYCVQGGHTSIRYIETVAISWHEKGFKSVEEAKSYAAGFSRDAFAVMKAFGLSGRKPGDSEWSMIDKWFKVYGFSRELVLDACSRTLDAIHAPSFKYADKILEGWKKAGVRSGEDVKRLDEEHAGRPKNAETKASGGHRGTGQNQFQNFPQRDTDYDALVLKQLSQQ